MSRLLPAVFDCPAQPLTLRSADATGVRGSSLQRGFFSSGHKNVPIQSRSARILSPVQPSHYPADPLPIESRAIQYT